MKDNIDMDLVNSLIDAMSILSEQAEKKSPYSYMLRGVVIGESDGGGYDVATSDINHFSNVVACNGVAVNPSDEVIMVASKEKSLPKVIVVNLSGESIWKRDYDTWQGRVFLYDGADPDLFLRKNFVTKHENCPTGDEEYYIETLFFGDDEVPSDRVQKAITKNSSPPKLFIRTCADDVWTQWVEK